MVYRLVGGRLIGAEVVVPRRLFPTRRAERILLRMENVASRYRRVIEELLSRRVPLVYRESINGELISIVSATGVPVLTLSRAIAVEAGIMPPGISAEPTLMRYQPQSIDSRRESGADRQEVPMPSVQPIEWEHPGTARTALKVLLERGGAVENVIVRLSRDQRFPRHGPRYRLARFALIGDVPFWLDAVTQRPLYRVSGYRLAELAE